MDHRAVQKMAKETMAYIRREIRPGMPLREVRRLCERKLFELGADSFWYYNVGAFVFSGEDTMLSVSGRNYETANRIIGADDVITIDLSPQVGDIWGDYARTIILEGGRVIDNNREIRCDELRESLEMERLLHDELRRFANPEMTFEQLYEHMNRLIQAQGYENLDFLGNLGHTIVRRKEDRVYIEKGNSCCLGEGAMFTFEPHIRRKGGKYGVKHENIYTISSGSIMEL